MPVKKTVKKSVKAINSTRSRSASPRRHSGRPAGYVIWTSLVALFLIWLMVAVRSAKINPPRLAPAQLRPANSACNNDPLITVPDCSILKGQ
jgi:hypothetical protein